MKKNMWKCQNCKKVNVPDTGFKMFIHYAVISKFDFGKEKVPAFGDMCQQIRLCSKCLKKKSLEIELN